MSHTPPPSFPPPSAIVKNTMNTISFVFITTKTITCVNTVRLRLQQYDLSVTRLRPKSLCLYMILFVKNYNVMDAPIIHIYNKAHRLAMKYLVWFLFFNTCKISFIPSTCQRQIHFDATAPDRRQGPAHQHLEHFVPEVMRSRVFFFLFLKVFKFTASHSRKFQRWERVTARGGQCPVFSWKKKKKKSSYPLKDPMSLYDTAAEV